MRPLDDAVEAERVGAAHQFEIVAQVRGAVARRMLAAHDQAHLHARPAHSGTAMPFPASSLRALAFFARLRPMPLRMCGALVN